MEDLIDIEFWQAHCILHDDEFKRRFINFWKSRQNFKVLEKANSFLVFVDTDGNVYGFCLNEQKDKLIASTDNNQIIVMNIQSNEEWKIVQTIQVTKYGYRLNFSVQDQFFFQPRTSDYLEVYDYDKNMKQFYQKSKVKLQDFDDCDNLFSCQYIKALNILAVNHGQFVNIFKENQNGEYKFIQSIEQQEALLYGRMADDGQSLIIWKKGSCEIQVRKLKFEVVLK